MMWPDLRTPLHCVELALILVLLCLGERTYTTTQEPMTTEPLNDIMNECLLGLA